jgi:hypothetical protein
MVGRPPRAEVAVRVELDDLLWARVQGLNLSELFREYLHMVPRETEIAAYVLVAKAQMGPTVHQGWKPKAGQG